MEDAIKVRPARASEVSTLAKLVESRLPDMMSELGSDKTVESRLASLVPDEALIVATRGTRLAGAAALDLDHYRVLACYLDPEAASPDTPKRLFRALEDCALKFGIRVLYGTARNRTSGFMKALGYEVEPSGDNPDNRLKISKRLTDQAEPGILKLMALCDKLGVPENYGVLHRMPLVPESTELVTVGRDIYDREQRMMPAAAEAWSNMKTAAHNAGHELQLVSAYRSIAFQTNLVKRKLAEGVAMKRILRVSAPPGFSEHHSGRAVDLTARGCRPLEEDFAKTSAYAWLKANARFFGFRESYPRNNRHQIAWEPWHWYYHRR